MSFGSMIGGSALGGGLEHMFQSADSIHMWEANNPATAVVDPLGYSFGKILGSSEKKKAQKQLAYYQDQLNMQYAMQKQAALEMPSLVRKGFEDAGYNALLALGQTGGATSAGGAHAGDYPHNDQRRQTNMLLMSALQNQEAQREQMGAQTDVLKSTLETQGVQRDEIRSRIMRNKVGAVVDAVKALGSIGIGAAGAVIAAKKLGLSLSSKARGKVLDLLPSVVSGGASSAARSSARSVAPSLFSRSIGPMAALTAAGINYAYGKAKLYAERKIGAKLPDATERKYQERNPRFMARPSVIDFRKLKQAHW